MHDGEHQGQRGDDARDRAGGAGSHRGLPDRWAGGGGGGRCGRGGGLRPGWCGCRVRLLRRRAAVRQGRRGPDGGGPRCCGPACGCSPECCSPGAAARRAAAVGRIAAVRRVADRRTSGARRSAAARDAAARRSATGVRLDAARAAAAAMPLCGGAELVRPGLGGPVLQPGCAARRRPGWGPEWWSPGCGGPPWCGADGPGAPGRRWAAGAGRGAADRARRGAAGPRRPALRPSGAHGRAHLLRAGRRSPDQPRRRGAVPDRLHRRPARPLQHRLPSGPPAAATGTGSGDREHGPPRHGTARLSNDLAFRFFLPVAGVDAERAPGGEVLHPAEGEHAEHGQPDRHETSVRVSVPSPSRAATSGAAAIAIGKQQVDRQRAAGDQPQQPAQHGDPVQPRHERRRAQQRDDHARRDQRRAERHLVDVQARGRAAWSTPRRPRAPRRRARPPAPCGSRSGCRRGAPCRTSSTSRRCRSPSARAGAAAPRQAPAQPGVEPDDDERHQHRHHAGCAACPPASAG